MPATGGTGRALHAALADISGLAWTPDGRFLVFTADGDLWRVRAEGGEAEKLLAGRDALLPAALAQGAPPGLHAGDLQHQHLAAPARRRDPGGRTPREARFLESQPALSGVLAGWQPPGLRIHAFRIGRDLGLCRRRIRPRAAHFVRRALDRLSAVVSEWERRSCSTRGSRATPPSTPSARREDPRGAWRREWAIAPRLPGRQTEASSTSRPPWGQQPRSSSVGAQGGSARPDYDARGLSTRVRRPMGDASTMRTTPTEARSGRPQ